MFLLTDTLLLKSYAREKKVLRRVLKITLCIKFAEDLLIWNCN